MLKVMAENDAEGITMRTKIFNSIYKVVKMQMDKVKSTFVTLPEKPRAKNCNEYRYWIISLMAQVLKIFYGS